METLIIRKPDDWHAHLRDGAILEAVAPYSAKRFGRVIVMPNLEEPVTTTERLKVYRARVEKALGPSCKPLMTYYLTDTSRPEEIVEGFKSGAASAVKLYPAGATTNSENGVTEIMNVYPVFEAMQNARMPLLLHGETVRDERGNDIDPKDREKVFLDTTLPRLLKDFPELKVVLEHASTKDAVDFVSEKGSRLGATITVHHLMLPSKDITDGVLKPHLHAMPVVKTEEDKQALRKAATSGNSRFFLGTDSAPHLVSKKESARAPAGIFTAPAALELYAHVFEEEEKLENFEAFASLNGPAFYGIPPNEKTITLVKEPWTIDAPVSAGDDFIWPLGYHTDPKKRLIINWRLAASPRGTRNTM